MMSELKPCPVPWCNGDVYEIVFTPWAKKFNVVCQHCKVNGPLGSSKQEAADKWNTRHEPVHAAETVEACARVAASYDAFNGCENIGTRDPVTGKIPCHLGDSNCLCMMKFDVVDEIEASIRALPTQPDNAERLVAALKAVKSDCDESITGHISFETLELVEAALAAKEPK